MNDRDNNGNPRRTDIHSRTRWTDDEIEHLTEHYPIAPSLAALAADLGRTLSAVNCMATELKITRTRDTRPWKAELLRLHSEGLHDAEIARRMNCYPGVARSRRRLLGLPMNPRPAGYMARVSLARSKARGVRDIGQVLSEAKRLKYGRQWPGCRTATEARLCQLLADAGKDGVTVAAAQVAFGSRSSGVGVTLKRLADDGIAVRRREGQGGRWVYTLAVRKKGRVMGTVDEGDE